MYVQTHNNINFIILFGWLMKNVSAYSHLVFAARRVFFELFRFFSVCIDIEIFGYIWIFGVFGKKKVLFWKIGKYTDITNKFPFNSC